MRRDGARRPAGVPAPLSGCPRGTSPAGRPAPASTSRMEGVPARQRAVNAEGCGPFRPAGWAPRGRPPRASRGVTVEGPGNGSVRRAARACDAGRGVRRSRGAGAPGTCAAGTAGRPVLPRCAPSPSSPAPPTTLRAPSRPGGEQWGRDPSIPGQAAARSRRDVRRRGGQIRPHQRRAVARPGPSVAQGRRPGRRRPPGGEGAGPRGRHGHLLAAVRRGRGVRRPLRLLRRHAARGQEAQPLDAADCRRRDAPALRGRRVRRRHDLLRAAQRAGHRRRAARDAAGHPARRPRGDLRVLHAHLGAVPHGLHRVPDACPAAGRARGQQQPGRVRVPRRVDPGVAGPAGARRAAAGGGLVEGRVAQPDGRHRGPAPGDQAG
ncbi:hypothetical protein SABIM44S_03144 [Streptomyces abikoensis]